MRIALLFVLCTAAALAQIPSSGNAKKLQGIPVNPCASPANGYVYTYNSANKRYECGAGGMKVVASGTGGGSGNWTATDGLGGKQAIAVTGSLTTDTVLCNITSANPHGSAPQWVDMLACSVSANGTLTAATFSSNGGSIAFYGLLTFSYVVLR